ncbi:MAG: hypothetical protein ABFS41_17545, partial [Myxococcota bacterium]
EAWLLERYPDLDAARAETDRVIFDGTARYIGETFRKTLHGEWWVDPKGKILNGLPHVGRARGDSYPICPLIQATSATDRRTGMEWSSLWRSAVAMMSGKAERSPLLDDPQLRKHIKVMPEEKTFNYWLSMMDRAHAELLAELPEAVGGRLDFSSASLDVLEAWLLERYPDGAAARAESQVLTLDSVARYIGETFRIHAGGQWWFDLEGWSHNGLPQLTGFPDANDPSPLCPLALAHEAAELREGDCLRATLRAKTRDDQAN